ncbi:hypothetical protein ACWDTG_08225 [Rhodococcus zopfii]|uniref:Mce-associated membrane protein n=1 Tax=Rhodococcus zopfii TaxID=43772 RepID=A0ABU3WSE7_9NOCA|nr:hypothetical protein [Rhodococcus zopfii]MDV2476900.1 hypothetical protein [Rhodococcus zopfii]
MADTNKAPEDASARRTWTLPVSIGAAVLIVLLIVSGIWLLIDRQSIRDRDERREAYLQAARQTVLNLTTIHSDTADADVQRLLDGATGDFKAEFEGREGPFVEVVQKAGVDTTGEVVEAGIQTEDGPCTSSLVASRMMVSNAGQPDASPRDFRLRVTICDEDGRLLASKVEFVP